MTDTAQAPPLISPKAVSDALAALGAYAQPPTDGQLAAAELAEGRTALVARLSNALYGSALAHVMTAEFAVAQAGSDTGYRHEAWRAAGADGEGTMILLHYTALRLAAELRIIGEHLPVDLGVMGAATGTAEALKLLLEVCTVRSMEDPRASAVTTNLSRASDQLAGAAERINTLFAAARDIASIIPTAVLAGGRARKQPGELGAGLLDGPGIRPRLTVSAPVDAGHAQVLSLPSAVVMILFVTEDFRTTDPSPPSQRPSQRSA